MRIRILRQSIGLALIFFAATQVAIPISQAQAPTPTPSPEQKSAPSTSYRLYLPFIQRNEPSAPVARKGVPLTYNDCTTVTAMGGSWEHSWGPTPADCPGIENVPMIWGTKDMNTTPSGNSSWIMGFNEPDSGSQSNLSPAQAAQLWRQIEEKYPTRKLLSPGSTSGNITWLVDFRNAYISAYGTPPRLDGLQVHCYAWFASQCTDYMQQFLTYASSWGVPEIWVTEFAFATTSPSSPSGAVQEMLIYINWMKNNPKFSRYAWFASKIQGNEWWSMPAFHTPLIDWNTGQPTSFGAAYSPLQ